MCEAKKSIDQIKWGIFLRGQGNGPTPHPTPAHTHTHTSFSNAHTHFISKKLIARLPFKLQKYLTHFKTTYLKVVKL